MKENGLVLVKSNYEGRVSNVKLNNSKSGSSKGFNVIKGKESAKQIS